MKYSIEGFGQEKLLEHNLDHRDAVFLRWFADFQHTGRMLTIVDDGNTYYWIQYSYVIEQIPIIGFSNDGSVRHYLKRLVDAEILRKCTRANAEGKGSRAYFCIDPLVWRDLTEKTDQRTEGYGDRDQRTDEYGGADDQRIDESGGDGDQRTDEYVGNDDQRIDEYGGPSDDGIDEDGESVDQRIDQYGQIPPSEEDSSSRGEDTQIESSVGADPPPPSDDSSEESIDPVVRVQEYLRRHSPGFYISTQTTAEYIRHFVRRHGVEYLEDATKTYAAKKSARQISKYFDNDFPEQLSDVAKQLDLESEGQKQRVCVDCEQPASVLLDWDGRRICCDCARRARSEWHQRQRSAS